MFWLHHLDTTDEKEYKQYRLAVKKRLLKKYSDILSDSDIESKKKVLEEIFRELETDYRAILKKI